MITTRLLVLAAGLVVVVGGCSHGPRFIPSSARDLPRDQLARLEINNMSYRMRGLKVDGHSIGPIGNHATVFVLPGSHTISFKDHVTGETSYDRRCRALEARGYKLDLDTYMKSTSGRSKFIAGVKSVGRPGVGFTVVGVVQYVKEGEKPVIVASPIGAVALGLEIVFASKWVKRNMTLEAGAGKKYRLSTPLATRGEANHWKITEGPTPQEVRAQRAQRAQRWAKEIDRERIKDITNGKTTKAEIEDWFGPTESQHRYEQKANGAVQHYVYIHVTTGFKSTVLLVWFDQNGVVVNSEYATHD